MNTDLNNELKQRNYRPSKIHPKYLKLDSGLREDSTNIIKVKTTIRIRGIKKTFLYSLINSNNFLNVIEPFIFKIRENAD